MKQIASVAGDRFLLGLVYDPENGDMVLGNVYVQIITWYYIIVVLNPRLLLNIIGSQY
jgi:hypothetical protein